MYIFSAVEALLLDLNSILDHLQEVKCVVYVFRLTVALTASVGGACHYPVNFCTRNL